MLHCNVKSDSCEINCIKRIEWSHERFFWSSYTEDRDKGKRRLNINRELDMKRSTSDKKIRHEKEGYR